MGWNIGSNNAANAIEVPVGSSVVTYRRALSMMALFVLLGAFLEGWKVMEKIGSGILSTSAGNNPLNLMPELAVIALLVAGLWIAIVTTFELPVSTSQSIVGSVIGIGFSFGWCPNL